jgi:hypothetical protein
MRWGNALLRASIRVWPDIPMPQTVDDCEVDCTLNEMNPLIKLVVVHHPCNFLTNSVGAATQREQGGSGSD